MAVNPKSYTDRGRGSWPVSYEAGHRAVAGDFPDLDGFIYINKVNRSGPGKTLDVDFVVYPGSGAFAQAVERCSVYMDFYHITEGWHRTVHIGTWNIKMETWNCSQVWGKSPNPPYGWRAHNGSSIVNPNNYLSSSELSSVSSMSYTAMSNLLFSKGLQCVNTDGSAGGEHVSGTRSFTHFEPWGVRYLSNYGNYSPTSAHVTPTASSKLKFIKYQGKCDGGAGTPLRIDQEAYVGETRYKLRFNVGSKWWEFEDQGTYVNEIDNPLLGIPDYCGNGQGGAENWPPRYDAKFYKKEGSNWNEKKGAGFRVSGGSWKVF